MKRDSNGRQDYHPHQIAALIARFRQSGIGLERFARNQGIPPGRLHYWVYQKPSPARRSKSSAPIGFQEVKLASCLPASAHWAAEISLPEGLGMRVSSVAVPVWIGELVQALRRPC